MFTSNSSIISRSSIPPIPSIINEEEYNFPEVNLDLQDWKIPQTPIKESAKQAFHHSHSHVITMLKLLNKFML